MYEDWIQANKEIDVTEVKTLLDVTNTLASSLTKSELTSIMQIYDKVISRLLRNRKL